MVWGAERPGRSFSGPLAGSVRLQNANPRKNTGKTRKQQILCLVPFVTIVISWFCVLKNGPGPFDSEWLTRGVLVGHFDGASSDNEARARAHRDHPTGRRRKRAAAVKTQGLWCLARLDHMRPAREKIRLSSKIRQSGPQGPRRVADGSSHCVAADGRWRRARRPADPPLGSIA